MRWLGALLVAACSGPRQPEPAAIVANAVDAAVDASASDSSVLVFAVVLSLYRLLELVMDRSPRTAERLEGRPVEVVSHGEIDVDRMSHVEITTPELFSLLRIRTVSHLGQIERAIIEPNGEVSVSYAPKDKVRPGLPIIPALYDECLDTIAASGTYSCRHCGHTTELARGAAPACTRCDHVEWTYALATPRIL